MHPDWSGEWTNHKHQSTGMSTKTTHHLPICGGEAGAIMLPASLPNMWGLEQLKQLFSVSCMVVVTLSFCT